jgi:cell division protease FtsH
MVAYFGMSEVIGNMSYYDAGSEPAFTKPFSEKTAQDIDSETRRFLSEAEKIARGVVVENREGLKKLAERLLEKETVFAEDLEEIFGPARSAAAKTAETLGGSEIANSGKTAEFEKDGKAASEDETAKDGNASESETSKLDTTQTAKPETSEKR